MRKLSFWNLLLRWFCILLVLTVVNAYTLKSPLLQNLMQASLGIYLLIRPIWPEKLGWHYPEKTCRRIIRITAAVQILLAFRTKFNF